MKREVPATIGAGAVALGLGASSMIHPALPIAGAFGLVAVALFARSPFGLALAFIAVLFTRPAEFFPQIAVLQLGKIASLGALAMLFVSKFVRQDASWRSSPANFFVIGLTIAVFLSSQVGTDRGASMATFKDVFVKILIVYALILNTVDTKKRYALFQIAITLCCVFIGGYGIWAKITGTASIEGSRAALVGYLGDPNDMAMTLLCCAPFTLQGVVSARGWRRVLFVVLAFFVVGGILTTQSRGGLLGTAGASYFIMRDRIKSRAVIGAGIAGMLVVGALAAGLGNRHSGAVGGGEVDESAQGRLDAWYAGGRMIMAKPLLGVGFSRFADNYLSYVTNTKIWKKHETHNAYIKCASETGLIGFFFYMGLLLTAAYAAWKSRANRDWRENSIVSIAARAQFCNLVAVCITSFFLSACWSWFIYILVAQAAVLGALDGTFDSKDEKEATA